MVFGFRRFACLLLFPLSAFAQSPDDSLALIPASGSIPGTVSVYFFPALPMGDFGDASGPNAGLATMGVGLGIEYAYPIGKTPLSWVSGAAVAINPVDTRKAAEIVGDQLPAGDVKVEGGTWFNAPLLTGLGFEGRPAPQVAFQVQVQAGFTIVNQGDYKFSSSDYSAVLASETAFAPGFMAGGGATFFDRLNLAVRFFRTAEAHMQGEFHDIDGQSAEEKGDIAISFLALTLGVRF